MNEKKMMTYLIWFLQIVCAVVFCCSYVFMGLNTLAVTIRIVMCLFEIAFLVISLVRELYYDELSWATIFCILMFVVLLTKQFSELKTVTQFGAIYMNQLISISVI